jgi:PAS domain S-box-containing protein
MRLGLKYTWLTTAVRVGLPVALAMVLVIGLIAFFMLPRIERIMMDDRRRMIRELTTIAGELLATYERRVEQGELSPEVARERAKAALRQFRFGDDGKEYFWIMEIRADGHPYTVMQPYFPEHSGVDQYNLQDASGFYFAREFVRVVQAQGEGFVTYQWQWKDDRERIVPKITHVREFKPWKWIVGTGIYLEDIDQQIGLITRALKSAFAIVLALVSVLSLFIIWQAGRSERHRAWAEKCLLESESRFRGLVENAADAIFLMDSNGRISDANSSAYYHLGYHPPDLIGLFLEKLVGPEDARKIITLCEGRPSNVPCTFESVHYRRDGSSYPVDIRINSLDLQGRDQLIFVSRDITDTKAAEAALRESEEKYRTVVDNSLGGIFIAQEGFFVYVNPRFVEIGGYRNADEVIGKHFEELVHPDFRQRLRDRYQRRLAGVPEPSHYEFRGLKSDGSDVWLEMLLCLVDYKGKSAIVGSIIDITRRKEMEAQLRQSQKMEAIGTLAGGIAHDFNNILTAVMGYAYLAHEELPPEHPGRYKLQNVLKACNRAQELVRHILTFSRQAQKEREPIQLHLLVKETLKLLRASIPSTIAIRQDIRPQAGAVMADATQMHQVVMNLCTNAYHAMRQSGGVMEVRLQQVTVRPEDITTRFKLTPGPHLCLSVSDTGHGIPKSVIDRIFEPYFTTKEKGDGTGMGLSVVHGIVEGHGGQVTVYSEPDKGATFKVYLPLAPVAEEKRDGDSTPPVQGSERILVVDDEEQIAMLMEQLLTSLGYHVTALQNSHDALELFGRDPTAYDAVITDMTMPGMTGKDLAARMLSVRPDLPIIICTGFSENIDQDSAQALGCRAFVMKPVMIDELSRTLRAALESCTLN